MAIESSVKQTLLELAIQAIDDSGEAGLRVSQLVEAAGVTLPALYHYFGNREGLIEAAQVERFVRSLREDAAAFIERVKVSTSRDDLQQTIEQLVTAMGTSQRTQVRWKRINAVGSTYARPALAIAITQAHDEVISDIVQSLLPLQDIGVIRKDIDLKAVVAWFNGAVLGKNLVEIAHSNVDINQWNRTLLEATFAVLFGPSHK